MFTSTTTSFSIRGAMGTATSACCRCSVHVHHRSTGRPGLVQCAIISFLFMVLIKKHSLSCPWALWSRRAVHNTAGHTACWIYMPPHVYVYVASGSIELPLSKDSKNSFQFFILKILIYLRQRGLSPCSAEQKCSHNKKRVYRNQRESSWRAALATKVWTTKMVWNDFHIYIVIKLF